jgi:hypothetical protein
MNASPTAAIRPVGQLPRGATVAGPFITKPGGLDMQPIDTRNTAQPMELSPAELQALARATVAGLSRDFTAAEDLAIIEGLFDDGYIDDVAAAINRPFDATLARFHTMIGPMWQDHGGNPIFSLAAQTALLEACRERAKSALH